MTNFKIIEEKEEGIKKHVIELDGEKYLVSTVELVTPEMKEAFTEEIVEEAEKEGRFETSVFSFDEGEPDLSDTVYSERYEGESEAAEGHEKILEKIKKGKIKP